MDVLIFSYPSSNSSPYCSVLELAGNPPSKHGLPFAPERLLNSSPWREERGEGQVTSEEVWVVNGINARRTTQGKKNEYHARTRLFRTWYLTLCAFPSLTPSLTLITNNIKELFRLLVNNMLSYFFCCFERIESSMLSRNSSEFEKKDCIIAAEN